MSLKEKTFCITAMVVFLFFAAIIAIAAIHLIEILPKVIQAAHGDNYTFNMSGFENETKLLDKCIANNQLANKNISKGELAECFLIYGGIDVNQTPIDKVKEILGIPKENDTGTTDVEILKNYTANLVLPFAQTAYGQEVDPRFYCFQSGYPYEQLCAKQEIEDTMNQLLERARQWNKEHP